MQAVLEDSLWQIVADQVELRAMAPQVGLDPIAFGPLEEQPSLLGVLGSNRKPIRPEFSQSVQSGGEADERSGLVKNLLWEAYIVVSVLDQEPDPSNPAFLVQKHIQTCLKQIMNVVNGTYDEAWQTFNFRGVVLNENEIVTEATEL